MGELDDLAEVVRQRQRQPLSYARRVGPAPAPQVQVVNDRGAARAAWAVLIVACVLAAIPFLGFAAWAICGPLLLVAFILSIVVLAKGGVSEGLVLLLGTLIVAPVLIVTAPFLTSALVIGIGSRFAPTPAAAPSAVVSPISAPPIPAAPPTGALSREERAAAALSLSYSYLGNGRNEAARTHLREIIEKYPGTPAAKDAADLLKSIPPATQPAASRPETP